MKIQGFLGTLVETPVEPPVEDPCGAPVKCSNGCISNSLYMVVESHCLVRSAGARSGLGPIWALMFFVKNVTFRVQTAPFDKITIDFWRSRRRLYIPDLLKAKKPNARFTFF